MTEPSLCILPNMTNEICDGGRKQTEREEDEVRTTAEQKKRKRCDVPAQLQSVMGEQVLLVLVRIQVGSEAAARCGGVNK